jgi:spermidine synthase
VGLLFEELARSDTHEGVLTLRRRRMPSLDVDVFEIKLDDEYLMSSLFTVAEIELARLALAELAGTDLDVAVGGLGLGCTARAVLEDDRVRSLTIVEALAPVITWHEQGLLPESASLTTDARARFVLGDFFAMVEHQDGLDPDHPRRRFDAIIVDIDHTPHHVLHASHAPFYRPDGLRRLATHLQPGGVFALWSDDPPDDAFLTILDEVFLASEAHVVPFRNALTGGESANTVYTARI